MYIEQRAVRVGSYALWAKRSPGRRARSPARRRRCGSRAPFSPLSTGRRWWVGPGRGARAGSGSPDDRCLRLPAPSRLSGNPLCNAQVVAALARRRHPRPSDFVGERHQRPSHFRRRLTPASAGTTRTPRRRFAAGALPERLSARAASARCACCQPPPMMKRVFRRCLSRGDGRCLDLVSSRAGTRLVR